MMRFKWTRQVILGMSLLLLAGCSADDDNDPQSGDIIRAWGTPELLETLDAGTAYGPQIDVAADGSAIAVWYQNDGTRNNVWSNRFDGTAWDGPELLETDDAGTAYGPQIAVAADGSAIAVWYQNDGTRNNVWVNRFDGTAWDGPELLETDDTGEAVCPQIAVAADGSAIAVWSQNDGTRYNLWANRFDGTAWDGPELLETDNDGNALGPEIAMASDGSAVAVWHQNDGTRYNVWANRFDGAVWGEAELLDSEDLGDAIYPQISLASDGSAMAVWMQNEGVRENVWTNRFDGTVWGGAELLETDDTGNARYPQIGMASDGSAIAVWYQHDGATNNIWSNRFDGTAWDGPELLETDDTGYADSVEIAVAADGSAIAVWRQLDDTIENLMANHFDGESWGTAINIEDDDTDSAAFAQISIGADGSAIVVWVADGPITDIWANRFE